MSKKIILRLLLALFVIALPFTLHAIYRWMTAYPLSYPLHSDQ